MSVGKKILQIRKEKGMPQEEFGKLFHVTRQTVSNWENEKSYPDLQTLVEISDMSGVSMDALLKEDGRMVSIIDKQKKTVKASRIVIGVLIAMLVLGGCMVKLLLDSFAPTTDGERNMTETGVRMYLNFPDAAPSRAIIRTYEKEEYENFSDGKLRKIRREIGGSMEGDRPALRLSEDAYQIRPVFQTTSYENIEPDGPPEILIRIYLDAGVTLPEDDETYQAGGEIIEYEGTLAKDEKGYYYELKDQKVLREAQKLPPCFIQIRYSVDGQEYISVSAFTLAELAELVR